MVKFKIPFPVQGAITSPFGLRKHPVTGLYKLHNGVDFGVPEGTPIIAPADGKVEVVNNSTTGGKQIVIRHNWFYTGYAHLSQQLVSVGQQVKQGDIIGYTGSTGQVTGPHLHFTVKALNFTYLNPKNYLI